MVSMVRWWVLAWVVLVSCKNDNSIGCGSSADVDPHDFGSRTGFDPVASAATGAVHARSVAMTATVVSAGLRTVVLPRRTFRTAKGGVQARASSTRGVPGTSDNWPTLEICCG